MLVLWSIVFTHVNIKELVEAIGVRNGYLLALGVALLGGVSTFTTASFYSTIGLLSIGGLSPVILALVTAPALLLGDCLFYYLGSKGRESLSAGTIRRVRAVERWFEKKPTYYRPLGIYIYSAFTPFPADILMVALAFINYSLRKAWLPILLGHITILTWLGYLARVTGTAAGF